MTARPETSIHGTVFRQFKNKPKEAIVHLMKVKEGEAIAALYRSDIGYIDITWGENDKKNVGYGLKHIIEKHGSDILKTGFNIEDFIPIIVQFCIFSESRSTGTKKVFENKMGRFVVDSKFNRKSKNWLLTAFSFRIKKTRE